MGRALSTDEFEKHRINAPRGEFLAKPDDWPLVPGSSPPVKGINVVLALGDSIYVLWRHRLPRPVLLEKDNEKVVWGGQYGCHEQEDPTLTYQRVREKDGRRRYPPEACGLCKMAEWFYQQVSYGDMDWMTKVFRFEADDPRNSRVLHAGGMCGIFNSKNLSPEEKKEMRAHGIYQDEAFKEEVGAKAEYLFVAAEYEKPEAGLQIAIMKQSLGDKVRGVIGDRRINLGSDEGDPAKNPFAIQWTYNNAKGIEFGKKYHARPMDRLPITDAVRAVISAPHPDVDSFLANCNQLEVRAMLEEHALIELPWDEWFGTARGQVAPKQQSGGSVAERAKAEQKKDTDPAPPSTPATNAEEVDCDECNKPMLATDKKCPHCGFVYEAEPEVAPPPQTARRGRRSAAAGPSGPPPQEEPKADAPKTGPFDNDDGDVPFLHCDEVRIGERWWPWS